MSGANNDGAYDKWCWWKMVPLMVAALLGGWVLEAITNPIVKPPHIGNGSDSIYLNLDLKPSNLDLPKSASSWLQFELKSNDFEPKFGLGWLRFGS